MNTKSAMFFLKAVLVATAFHFATFDVAAQPRDVVSGTASFGGQSMEGSWTALVTIRDCATGTPFLTFPALQTYMQGGTMHDSSADARRSPGHGIWRHVLANEFEAAFRFFNFDVNGIPQGTTRVVMRNVVDRRGHSFTTNATVKVFDMAGSELNQACATSVASRFALESEQ